MKKLCLIVLLFIGSGAYSQDSLAIYKQIEINLKTLPVLWQQHAAEYRALCYQAFNIATLRLNEIPANKLKSGKLAIITDLDETILENSYAEAQLIIEGKERTSTTWKKWTSKSAATAVPGAVEFLQAAKQKGLTIFYISNRDTGEVKSTLINLKKLQLPNADTEHMLFLSNTSSKEIRRQTVMNRYDVIMLMGDNLNDFMQVFEGRNIADRIAETDKVRTDWGRKFIVLPNATYGEWEHALYDYEDNLTRQQRDAKRKQKLIGY